MKNFINNLQLFFTDWNKWRAGVTLKRAMLRCQMSSQQNNRRYYMFKRPINECQNFPSERRYFYGNHGYVWLLKEEIDNIYGKKHWKVHFHHATAVFECGRNLTKTKL